MKEKLPKTLQEAKDEIRRLRKQLDYEYKSRFIHLELKELRALRRFQMKHMACERGAIGGATTIMLSPTSIGIVVQVKCHCGKEKNVTDYSVW